MHSAKIGGLNRSAAAVATCFSAQGGVKHISIIVVGIAVSGISLIYALWGVDYAKLATVFSEANYLTLLPFLACQTIFVLSNATRWLLILRPLGRYSVREAMPSMMIGLAGNNLFPARLGELVRSVVFARQFGVPASGVLVTVGLERIFDVLAILLYYLIAVAFSGPFPAEINAGVLWATVVTGAVSLAIVLFLHMPMPFIALWDRLARGLPASMRAFGHRLLRNTATALASLKSWRSLAGLVAQSMLRHGAGLGMIWLSLVAFNDQPSIPKVITLLAAAAVAVTVPSAPGFVGALQAAFVFALLPFGVSKEVALAASVYFVVAQWVPVTAVGMGYLVAAGLRLRELRAAADRLEV